MLILEAAAADAVTMNAQHWLNKPSKPTATSYVCHWVTLINWVLLVGLTWSYDWVIKSHLL